MEEFDYELKNSFEYAHAGQQQKAQFITLFAPGMKHMKHREPLKQAFYQAMMELGNKEEGGERQDTTTGQEQEKIKGSDLLIILRASKVVDTFKLGLHFIELLTSDGIAKVGGDEKMTKPLIDKLSPEDFDGIMGEYLANFIAASS